MREEHGKREARARAVAAALGIAVADRGDGTVAVCAFNDATIERNVLPALPKARP